MRIRLVLFVPAVAVAFVAGLTCSLICPKLAVRDAQAEVIPFAATIYVPSDGLAFRTFDGHVVARLTSDARGGVFELYDEHEQVATRVRGDAPGRVRPPPPAVPQAAAAGTRTHRSRDFGF